MAETVPVGRLLGPAQIRRLARELEVNPTKKLGQNFVHDAGTVRRIAALEVGAGDEVIEIGPGLGSLTLALLETGARVTAVEIDPRLAGALKGTVQSHLPAAAGNLEIITEDALNLSAQQVQSPLALVANLPYNVSVPVLLHVLAEFPTIRRVVVMVQKEVAERLVAAPGSRTYGSPSVKLAWYGKARMGGAVGRKVFWPEPNVDSALVVMQAETPPGDPALRAATFSLVDAAFSQRRKMIRASLREALGGEQATAEIMRVAGVDPTLRPEQLGVTDFVRLAQAELQLGEER